MNHTDFFKSLKSGPPRGPYIFHGEEEFVKDSALRALTSTLNEVSRELNLQTLEAPTAEELISACDTLPFFDERRIVICRSLPTDSDAKAISAYLPALPESTLLVFFIRGKAKETLSIVKTIKAAGGLVSFDALGADEAARWVYQNAKRHGAAITESAARHMVALCGTDVSNLSQELAKAAAYAGEGREITKEIISACVIRNLEIKVFAMMDYFIAGKAQDGIRAYRHMLAEGESPFGMAALMEGQFKQLLTAKGHLDKGLNREQALKLMGGGYPAKKACENARRYSRQEIVESLRRFADVAYLQVSGQQEAAATLEQALVRCMPRGKLY